MGTPLKSSAWVVVEEGVVLTRTLMDTQRGAMVNWLVTERYHMVLNTTFL